MNFFQIVSRNVVCSTICLLVSTVVLSACAPVPYTMDAPPRFKRFDDKRSFKFITADGIRLKAREVDNYPLAELSFWSDATENHLVQTGYVHNSTDCFQTTKGLDGCTLNFSLPHGAEDWIFQVTIFVVKDTIVLIEATGEFNRFMEIQNDLKAAIKTFSPNL